MPSLLRLSDVEGRRNEGEDRTASEPGAWVLKRSSRVYTFTSRASPFNMLSFNLLS